MDTEKMIEADVRIKALEWVELSVGCLAHTPFGAYWARYNRSGHGTHTHEMVIAGGELPKSFHDGLEEAKDAAQADYDARIRSALA